MRVVIGLRTYKTYQVYRGKLMQQIRCWQSESISTCRVECWAQQGVSRRHCSFRVSIATTSVMVCSVLLGLCVGVAWSTEPAPVLTDARSVALRSISAGDRLVQVGAVVEELPVRLSGFAVARDWAIGGDLRLRIKLENSSGQAWNTVDAACREVNVAAIPEVGLASGDALMVNVVLTRPQKPGLTPHTIRFLIDGKLAELPVLVDWQSAGVSLRTSDGEQLGVWAIEAKTRQGWRLQSVSPVNDEVEQTALWESKDTVLIGLTCKNGTEDCRLRLVLVHETGTESEQDLSFPLQSGTRRRIPAFKTTMKEIGHGQ